ncbi:hypothetical protein OAE79_02170 [Rhodopirellula sp.]|nr:sugar-binding protein [Rhodopirellula sp.]MDB4679123.1 hypothetical protein [Rhodopirellula sp.]
MSCFSCPGQELTKKGVKKPQVIQAKQASPTIDGMVDEVWKKSSPVSVNRSVASLLRMDAKDMATASVQLLWDEQHLYALWHVSDSKLSVDAGDDWEQDSVELFLDRNFKRSIFYQFDDAQYRSNYEGRRSGQGEGYVHDEFVASASKTADGYLVEMSILIVGDKLEVGRKMGVEMQVNDNRGGVGREAVAKWNHTEDDSWEDTSNFGVVELQ